MIEPEKDQQTLYEWWQQARQGATIPALTRMVVDQMTAGRSAQVGELLMEIDKDMDDEVDVLWQATVDDEMPVADTYPTFNFAFLSTEAQPPQPQSASAEVWPLAAIQAAFAEGITYLHDQINGVFALVGQALNGLPAGMAVRSTEGQRVEPGAQLLHYEVGEKDGFAWNMEVTAFAENATTCTIEVSILQLGADVENIAMTLYDGEQRLTQMTNEDGFTVFTQIPQKNLGALTIHRAS